MSEQDERIDLERIDRTLAEDGTPYDGDPIADLRSLIWHFKMEVIAHTLTKRSLEAADARVQALEAERDEARDAVGNGLRYEADLEAENAHLKAALKRYGQHESACGSIVADPCDCGLDAALTEPRREEERE